MNLNYFESVDQLFSLLINDLTIIFSNSVVNFIEILILDNCIDTPDIIDRFLSNNFNFPCVISDHQYSKYSNIVISKHSLKRANNPNIILVIQGEKDVDKNLFALDDYVIFYVKSLNKKKQMSYNRNLENNNNNNNSDYNKVSGTGFVKRPLTLIIFKPHILLSNCESKVIEFLYQKGFTLCFLLRKKYSVDKWKTLYDKYQDKDFFEDMCTYLSSKDVVITWWTHQEKDPIEYARSLMGDMDPSKDQEKTTLRGIFGKDLNDNGFHSSDSVESFEREKGIFAKDRNNFSKFNQSRGQNNYHNKGSNNYNSGGYRGGQNQGQNQGQSQQNNSYRGNYYNNPSNNYSSNNYNNNYPNNNYNSKGSFSGGNR